MWPLKLAKILLQKYINHVNVLFCSFYKIAIAYFCRSICVLAI